MTSATTSSYGYVNAALPRTFRPPQVARKVSVSIGEMTELIGANYVSLSPVMTGSVSTAEAILELFLHDEVAFGPETYVTEDRGDWLSAINRFVDQRRTIEFVAMAFPYKVPNPVKTGHRRRPDAGEALMVRRFQMLLDAISEIYPPGARLTILEEGILGRCQGVDPADIAAYRDGIELGVIASGSSRESGIDFVSLDELIWRVPNFEARWYFEQERLRSEWEAGNLDIVSAYDQIHPGQRSSVPLREYDGQKVIDALHDPDASSLRYIREYINAVSHRAFFAYRALLNIRDVSNYVNEVRPGAIKLTVSPKRGNLAVLPINKWTNILPYHGAPVLSSDGQWTIDYHGNLGGYADLEALCLAEDRDEAPFAYRVSA